MKVAREILGRGQMQAIPSVSIYVIGICSSLYMLGNRIGQKYSPESRKDEVKLDNYVSQ